MIPREDIQKILEYGCMAPSGDNSQPWRFKIDKRTVHIFNEPSSDESLYNFRQQASYVAHGALAENILIAAPPLGYSAQLAFFPEATNANYVARVTFEPAVSRGDPLFDAIPKRTTNRKPYDQKSIKTVHAAALIACAKELGRGTVKLLEDRIGIEKIAHAISINERVVLENQHLHQFLFQHIRWTDEEARKNLSGMHLKTFELRGLQTAVFRLFRSWGALSFFNKLGAARRVAKDNAKVYSSSAAIGIVLVPNNTSRDFLTAGRIMQRVWLKATVFGLSMQPVTGVILLMQRILANEAGMLSPQHIELITSAYRIIQQQFGIEKETIAMLFRVGQSDAPTARTKRYPVETLFMP